MTFQTDSFAFEGERAHLAFDTAHRSDAGLQADAGERIVRFVPRYAGAPCDVRVRYSVQGPVDAPVLVVQGGISAHRHVAGTATQAGWWEAIAGPGRTIDTTRCRLLSIDWLERADLGEAAAVGSGDQAVALALLLDGLGIRRICAYVGASYGAMVGLAFAARHPQRLQRLVAIAGAHRAHPLSVALRNIQREIVRLGERFGEPSAGLDLARRLAMTTYRGEREFAERCAAAPAFEDGRFKFAEEDWLKAAGAGFSKRFASARYLSLSESIDLHRVDPAAIRALVTLVGIASDRVVPLADLCELQRGCGAAATLHVIDSRYGHDAFLKEEAQIGALLQEALAGIASEGAGA